MDVSELLPHLARDVATIEGVLAAAPGARVERCPGWSVADLVRHHGGVHRWATAIVESGGEAADGYVGPQDLVELAAWYRAGADRLVSVLAATDPDRSCWTFGRPPARTWFWTRRQVLEAAVHRWDAQRAAGPADGFPAPVAAAGLSEVADDLFPRQVALGRTPALSSPVLLRALDLDRTWVLGGAGHGSAAAEVAAAEVAGPADDLLLLLWRRADLDGPGLVFTGPDELRAELAAARFAP